MCLSSIMILHRCCLLFKHVHFSHLCTIIHNFTVVCLPACNTTAVKARLLRLQNMVFMSCITPGLEVSPSAFYRWWGALAGSNYLNYPINSTQLCCPCREMFWSKKSDPKTLTMVAKRTYEVMMKSPQAYSNNFYKIKLKFSIFSFAPHLVFWVSNRISSSTRN